MTGCSPLAAACAWLRSHRRPGGAERIPLEEGWTLQSSARWRPRARALPARATRPRLAHDHGPQHGRGRAGRERHLPGSLLRDEPARASRAPTYPIGERFTLLADAGRRARSSPRGGTARSSTLPASAAGRTCALHFDGINYRANIWVNGTQIDTKDRWSASFRRYEFDVTALARPGAAQRGRGRGDRPRAARPRVHVGRLEPDAAPTRTWACGATCTSRDSGPLALRNPHVVTELDLPSLRRPRG